LVDLEIFKTAAMTFKFSQRKPRSLIQHYGFPIS